VYFWREPLSLARKSTLTPEKGTLPATYYDYKQPLAPDPPSPRPRPRPRRHARTRIARPLEIRNIHLEIPLRIELVN
jgi:hypothetical protein